MRSSYCELTQKRHDFSYVARMSAQISLPLVQEHHFFFLRKRSIKFFEFEYDSRTGSHL